MTNDDKTNITTGEWVWPSDWHEHEALTEPVINAAETFLATMYGERCPDFESDCECCKRWAALDVMIENPFDKPEAEPMTADKMIGQ